MDGIVILASSLVEKDHPIFSQIALLLLIPFFLSMVIGIPCFTYSKDLIAGICALLFLLLPHPIFRAFSRLEFELVRVQPHSLASAGWLAHFPRFFAAQTVFQGDAL